MAAEAKASIIKKIEVVEGHGHHGGAWKVAYADFMTAMMAFFLLLWILSSSDEQKLRGIAEYFTEATLPGGSGVLDGATIGPPGTLSASNGASAKRGSEGGEIDDSTPALWEVKDTTATVEPVEKVAGNLEGRNVNPAGGAAVEQVQLPAELEEVGLQGAAGQADDARENDETGLAGGAADHANATENAQLAGGQAETDTGGDNPDHAADDARFEQLQADIAQAMQNNPDLRPLQANVVYEKTPEGLKIQIVDQDGQPMFASGKANMLDATQKLMAELGTSLSELPNKLVVSGHTDSVQFAGSGYDNWDLSSDRANATRRVLSGSGVDPERIIRVSGMADTDHLVPEDPKHASNRRISLLLQYESVEAKPDMAPKRPSDPAAKPVEKPSTGEVQKAQASEPEPAPVPEQPAPKQEVAEVAPQPPVPVIDDKVFQQLRSALR